MFFLLERLDLFVERGEFGVVRTVGCGVGLVADGFALDFELAQAARDLIELFGLRIAFHAELGSGFVHEVDGLVGEEAVGDVAMGEGDGGDEGIVLNAHVMVVLVALFQSAQDGDGVFGSRFVDHYGLEAAFEGLVLLEILLVFFQRGGTDAAEFAACQSRFENVGRIHGAFALTGTHEGVDFVDEEDDATLSGGHFVDHALEALFKFAFVFGTGHECAHVEREDALVAQVLRYVAASDALCQTFDDGGFTGTGFADENRVVLGAARKDLQHPTNLFVASDHGVQFAVAGFGHEVAGVFLQGLVGVFARSGVGLASAAEFLDGSGECVGGHAGVFQQARCGAFGGEEGEQERFESDELVAVAARNVLRCGESSVGFAIQIRFAAVNAGQALEFAVECTGKEFGVHPGFAEEKLRNVLSHGNDPLQKMGGGDGLSVCALCRLYGVLHSLLGFDGEIVEVHIFIVLFALCE